LGDTEGADADGLPAIRSPVGPDQAGRGEARDHREAGRLATVVAHAYARVHRVSVQQMRLAIRLAAKRKLRLGPEGLRLLLAPLLIVDHPPLGYDRNNLLERRIIVSAEKQMMDADQLREEHQRNTRPMLISPRCGARTRRSTECRAPAVSGRKRCRMHGGADDSGAPANNKNALKHGAFTQEALQQRAELRALIAEARKLMNALS
jgi:hypothetical protein